MSDTRELTKARARDVKVGDTIATRTHVFPLTITAREVRRGVIWLKYTNQTGKAEWHNTPPDEAVTILDRRFPHLMTQRFKPGDKVTYFSTVTRLTMHNGTVMDDGVLLRDEEDDPDELVYRAYLVKAAGAPSLPLDAGVGSRWSEDSLLHGWLEITDPLNAKDEALRLTLS